MISRLAFEVDWLGAEHGSGAERTCFGGLTVRADDTPLTRVLDLLAQTPRDSVRVSLHHLACWFADNWWRLRWEPSPTSGRPSVAWRMAHDMSAAGGGYMWPAMRFTSDGETVRLQARPTRELHTVQYLDEHDVVCSGGVFEHAIDDLLSLVLARQNSFPSVDTQLENAWNAVLEERRDAEAATFRRHEAMLSLDPGEVDDAALAAMFQGGAWMGEDALDETLASSDAARFADLLGQLSELRARTTPRLDVRGVLEAAKTWSPTETGCEPWERGASLARHFREHWSLEAAPLSDQFLSDLLQADIHDDALAAPAGAPVVAFKDDGDTLVPALKPTTYPTSRRFAIARLLADTAVAAAGDALHPLTDCYTARQKLQRSAAQEFLCPVSALKERLNLDTPDAKNPDEDEIADAAEYFQVSPLLIQTTLVNKRLAPRSLLGKG